MARKVEKSETATFVTDDKRAQYARLVIFNHGVEYKLISKDSDVNSVSEGDLQKAFKSLVGGTLLEGKEGIEEIKKLTKAGATDPKVAERGLTTAYAQEVRPFLKRGLLAPSFGRRAKPKVEKPKAEKAAEPVPANGEDGEKKKGRRFQ